MSFLQKDYNFDLFHMLHRWCFSQQALHIYLTLFPFIWRTWVAGRRTILLQYKVGVKTMLTALPELLKIKLSGEGFFDLNYDSFIAFAFV
jgi:hypothetical protein